MAFDPERDPEKLLKGIKPSNESNWFSGGTAHILPLERKRATFDHDEMTVRLSYTHMHTHTHTQYIYMRTACNRRISKDNDEEEMDLREQHER